MTLPEEANEPCGSRIFYKGLGAVFRIHTTFVE